MPFTVQSKLGGILLIQPTAKDMTLEKALAHPLRWDQERIDTFLSELKAL